jgi:hypothetical protein
MHRVSCEQLGTMPTKEASYKAANARWADKLAMHRPTLHPHYQTAIENLQTIEAIQEMGDGPIFIPPGLSEGLDVAALHREGRKANSRPLPAAMLEDNPFPPGEARTI